MKKPEQQTKAKPVIDTNPHSKPNKEFRERHDIDVNLFNRLTKQHVAQYG